MKNIINKIKYWLKPEVPKEILNLLNEKLIPTNIIKIRKFVYKTEILTNKPLNVGDILWEVSDFNTYIISDRENNIYEIKKRNNFN